MSVAIAFLMFGDFFIKSLFVLCFALMSHGTASPQKVTYHDYISIYSSQCVRPSVCVMAESLNERLSDQISSHCIDVQGIMVASD